jgi:hypothetical protein
MLKVALPKLVNIEKAVSRKGKAENVQQPIPKTLGELQFDLNLCRTKTDVHENFLMADTGPADPERVVIFGSQTDLARLSTCDVWLVDGTFWTCPDLFYQLWVVHGRYGYSFLFYY